MERCTECGSWGVECGSDKPVADCSCARCANAAVRRLKVSIRMRNEHRTSLIIHYKEKVAGAAKDLAEAEERLLKATRALDVLKERVFGEHVLASPQDIVDRTINLMNEAGL